jgi:hypothetical protein
MESRSSLFWKTFSHYFKCYPSHLETEHAHHIRKRGGVGLIFKPSDLILWLVWFDSYNIYASFNFFDSECAQIIKNSIMNNSKINSRKHWSGNNTIKQLHSHLWNKMTGQRWGWPTGTHSLPSMWPSGMLNAC